MSVDMDMFEEIRARMGPRLITAIAYFHEDGVKAVDIIESAQRGGDASAMIMPAQTLKIEARQLAAVELSELCAEIEDGARDCVEIQEGPEELLVPVARLRGLFSDTMAIFTGETNPIRTRVRKTAS